MRNNDGGHAVLVGKIIVELLKIGLPIALLFDLLGIVVEIQRG